MADRLLLLLCQLGLLGACVAEAVGDSTLDGEGREHVFEAREDTLLLLLSVDHRGALAAEHGPFVFLLEEVAHADVVNLPIRLMDIGDCLHELGVPRGVLLEVRPDALPMERMLARVHEEVTVVEDGSEADVAVLSRVDRDVPILLVTALRAEQFSVVRVLLDLTPKLFDLLLVVIETIAQVFFHVAHFCLLREQVKKVFDFQDVVLSDDGQSLLHFHLVAT